MNSENSKREQVISGFNPNENGLLHNGIFGLPFSPDDAQVVLLPIPWEVTVSYSSGTSGGPLAILEASQQIDLYDPLSPGGWKAGFAMLPEDVEIKKKNDQYRKIAASYISQLSNVGSPDINIATQINTASEELNNLVESKSSALMQQGKIVGIVGGEHSVPFGFLRALAAKYSDFGILQFDAHADLRPAYEGFTHSHASIMYNALSIPQISKIVQVGIRDLSEGENELAASEERVSMFTDYSLRNALMSGVSWGQLWDKIVSELPRNVYVSFDIDALQAWLCPHTGTPVPGGFTIEEAFFILRKMVESGRKIIGFDLVEVAPGEDEWDGNVGARVLYKLCLLAARSNGL
jgi:agmatinase